MIVVGFRDACLPPGFVPGHSNLFSVHCQCGGYACHQVDLVGFVLRLVDVDDFALRPLAPLVAGFRQIGETGLPAGTPFTDLGFLAPTWGEPYERPVLDRLSGVLDGHLRLPALREGREGLVTFELDDHLRSFGDWPTLSVVPRGDLVGSPYLELSDHSSDDFDVAPSEPFSGKLLEELRVLGRALQLDLPPLAFLVWENSD